MSNTNPNKNRRCTHPPDNGKQLLPLIRRRQTKQKHNAICVGHYPSFYESPQFRPHFYWGSYIAQSVVFCRVFCLLLIVILVFYFWTSHLNSTHWTRKRPRHMTLEIQVLAWDRHTNVAGDKSTNIIPILLFFITGSPTTFGWCRSSLPKLSFGWCKFE
jgi:hypothetical protein